MKFSCSQCQSKYSIADDKVRGKVLKIRCAKCGSLVEVRGAPKRDSLAPAPGKPAEAKAAPESIRRPAVKPARDDADPAVWFVAIDDRPVGPISARDVAARWKEGKVDGESLSWKEGMADWIELSATAELVGLLARLGIEATARPAPPEPPKPAPPEPPKPAPPESEAKRAEEEFFGEGRPLAKLRSIPPPRRSRADRWVKLAAIGFFAVAVAVLCLILFSDDRAAEPKVVEKVVERVVEKEKIVYRDRVVDSSGLPTGADSDLPDRKGVRAGRGKDAAKGSSEEEEKKRRLLEQLGASSSRSTPVIGGSASGGGAGQGAASTAASPGGAELTDRDLSAVVGRNKGSLQVCYEQSMKKGEAPDDRDVKVLVGLTVGGSGAVKKVSVSGPGAQYAGLKGCIESAAKKWIFPAKQVESAAEFPFVFTPK